MARALLALLIGAILVGVPGCSVHQGTTNVATGVQVGETGSLTKSAAPVGLRLAPPLTDYVFTAAETLRHRIGLGPPLAFVENPIKVTVDFQYRAELGSASAAMFQAIWDRIMERPVVLTGEEGPVDTAIACVVAPSIRSAAYTRFEPERYQMIEQARIEYRFAVEGRDGRSFGDWLVVGESVDRHPALAVSAVEQSDVERHEADMRGFRSAMADAAQRFVAGLWSQPAIQACLRGST